MVMGCYGDDKGRGWYATGCCRSAVGVPPRHTSGSSSGTRVPTEGRARQGPATVADEAGCSASGVRSQLAPTRSPQTQPPAASQPRQAGARARALAGARERTKRAPTRRVRLAAPAHLRRGRRGARLVSGPRGEALGGQSAGRGSAGRRKRARVGGLWHEGKREYARGARGRGRIAGRDSPGAPELRVGVSPPRSSIHASRRHAAGSSARGTRARVAQ